jgi:hypothetical protein
VKKWKLILLGLAGLFIILQFTNPARTNPPVQQDGLTTLQAPAGVTASLHAACYDCHSHETKWPFYARLAPASWLVVMDVNDGRKKLNLSRWPADPAQAARQLDRINEAVDDREMPPKKYTLIHADARLTDAQRKEILDWTAAAADKLRAAITNQ